MAPPPEDLPAIAAWWADHDARVVAARAAGGGPANYVETPKAFDVTVDPQKESLQAAVDRCPDGGTVLLLPGTHVGGAVLAKTVHLFGRGAATLRSAFGACVTCKGANVTLDGVILRQVAFVGGVHYLLSCGTVN